MNTKRQLKVAAVALTSGAVVAGTLICAPAAGADPSNTRVQFCLVKPTGERVANAPVVLQEAQPGGSLTPIARGDSGPSGCTSFYDAPPNRNYVMTANFGDAGCSSWQAQSSPSFGPAFGYADLGQVIANCQSVASGPSVGLPLDPGSVANPASPEPLGFTLNQFTGVRWLGNAPYCNGNKRSNLAVYLSRNPDTPFRYAINQEIQRLLGQVGPC